MKRVLVALALGVATLVSAGAASAQGGAGRAPGMGRPGANRMFDSTTVSTVTGQITEVRTVTARPGGAGGIHLVLATGQEAIDVHLGPAWYVNRQALRLATGDRVTVRGSRVSWAGAPAIIAIEVRRGDGILKLRTEAGVPLWSNRVVAAP